ncbi:uncharacterized protein LOC121991573 [Zingiber officinale]|uniref:Nudix hydrolase domain-containing protein n=1 Tax=Zingiber officinale TaxID=94328 RepID=A0A8J5FYN1_ZINOF|nr:uncharacterized protein LOC121991573 [Zingiber officinale]KAG6498305.1 hypothetical protein ZIOFF_046217 [Zingiber officinale]
MRSVPSRVTAGLIAAFLSACPFPSPPNLLFFAAAAAALSVLHLSKARARPLTPLCSRREVSLTVAMRSTVSPPPSLTFSSPESLSDWIRPHLPFDPVGSWGAVPGSKSLVNLWIEVNRGETSLLLLPDSEGDPSGEKEGTSTILRVVNVAIVRIRNSRGEVLVESHQILSDGTVRHRYRPLSEKMMPGEAVEEAAVRAVREELGKDAVRIIPGSYRMRMEDRASASYPGLPGRYILHTVDADVEGLPEVGEFSTEENGEGVEAAEKGVFVRKHFWKWIADDGGMQQSWE